MAEIHELIRRHGADVARRQAATRNGLAAIETACQVMAEEREALGFTYSGFALTSLPHKQPPATFWRREGHNITLLLQSGLEKTGEPVGLPFGSYARFILLFLQSEALRSRSPEIELGRSMQAWMARMNISAGGKNYRIVREQARRISLCRLTFFNASEKVEVIQNAAFVESAITVHEQDRDLGQPTLWSEHVRLDNAFYQALCKHPVPLSETALRAIGPRSMSLDIYIWLAYRLHALRRATDIGWPSLHAQFGAGFKRIRAFRENFTDALAIAVAAYPHAKVGVDERGVTLHPSPPAIQKAS